jgi:thioredoxin 1
VIRERIGTPQTQLPRQGPLPKWGLRHRLAAQSDDARGVRVAARESDEYKMANNLHSWNDSNFEAEVLKAEGPVLVDFTATWCGPCRMLAPIVEKLANDYVGKLKVGKVDIDAAPALAAKYNIKSVPTVMVFEGGAKKAAHTGLAKAHTLLQLAGLS